MLNCPGSVASALASAASGQIGDLLHQITHLNSSLARIDRAAHIHTSFIVAYIYGSLTVYL